MKKLLYPAIAVILLLTSATIAVNADEVKISDDHKIMFESKDPSGSFTKMNGTIHFDPKDLANSSFDLQFPVNSINTGNKMKDTKAQTAEWFDAGTHPNVTYKSSKITKTEKGYMVFGTLTIKGKSKEKKIPLRVVSTEKGYKFYGAFPVNRMDFKVGKPSKAVPNVMKVKYVIPTTK